MFFKTTTGYVNGDQVRAVEVGWAAAGNNEAKAALHAFTSDSKYYVLATDFPVVSTSDQAAMDAAQAEAAQVLKVLVHGYDPSEAA